MDDATLQILNKQVHDYAEQKLNEPKMLVVTDRQLAESITELVNA